MPFIHRSRPVAILATTALGLALFGASLTWQVPTVQAGSALDAQASELVRLINGARSANGKSALNVDPFLASVARDGPIPCPDDPVKTISGRTQDFAAYGQMSHNLRNCDSATYSVSNTSFVSVLISDWSYGSVGEILLVNGGYGNGAFLYTTTGSRTWQTWTYSTTGHAMLGWQSSSGHWSIILGSYDRVGCGGWAGGSSDYYDCVFSSSGPNGVVSPPTRSPFSNPLPTAPPARTAAPTVAPRPHPVAAPTATPIPAPTPTASDDASPMYESGGAVASGTYQPPTGAGQIAEPSPAPSGVGPGAISAVEGAQATPDPKAAGAVLRGNGEDSAPTYGIAGLPISISALVAAIAGSGLVLLAGCLALLSIRRRGRREAAG